MKQKILEYQLQLTLLDNLFQKSLISKIEYCKIKEKLNTKYKVSGLGIQKERT